MLLRTSILIVTGWVFFFGTIVNASDAAVIDNETSNLLVKAVEKIGGKGTKTLLTITNAPYLRFKNVDGLQWIGMIENNTGCTVGQGNLLFFQRNQNSPLRIALFNKKRAEMIVISKENEKGYSEKIRVDHAQMLSAKFWESTSQYQCGKDLSTLATMAVAWAKGAPYDFLKAAELHNHLCPGLVSGYLFSRFVLEQFPLSKDERYHVISSPLWCKEDAIQVMLDTTAGSRRLITRSLSAEEKKSIRFENPAGMVVLWNRKTKSGKGIALSVDYTNRRKLTPKGTPKQAEVIAMIPYLNQPQWMISEAATFKVDEALLNQLKRSTLNPYAIAGLLK